MMKAFEWYVFNEYIIASKCRKKKQNAYQIIIIIIISIVTMMIMIMNEKLNYLKDIAILLENNI